MSDYSKVINVTFKDASRTYPTVDDTDVIGSIFYFPCGPNKQWLTLTKDEFFKLYPKEVVTEKNDAYLDYAQLCLAFDAGAEVVEVYNYNDPPTQSESSEPEGHIKNYNDWVVYAYDSTNGLKNDGYYDSSKEQYLRIRCKYPGSPVNATQFVEVYESKVMFNHVFFHVVYGQTGASEYIESFWVTFDSFTKDGVDYRVDRYLEANSEYLEAIVDKEIDVTRGEPSKPSRFTWGSGMRGGVWCGNVLEGYDTSMWAVGKWEDWISHFADILSTNATIILPSNFGTWSSASGVQKYYVAAADTNKSLVLLTDYDDWAEALKSNELFSFTMQAARTIFTINGWEYKVPTIAGWAGRMCYIAKTVRVNQLPSAFHYGSYPYDLVETTTFSDALDNQEVGINSVINTASGNYLWAIRSFYPNQSSYFGQANVVRVTAMFLRNVYPILMNYLHTDAASNSITMAQCESELQYVLDNFVSKQNLKADSNLVCNQTNNTDTTTNKGRVLNVAFNLWFIGLVEKISISIVATDSTVDTKISQ